MRIRPFLAGSLALAATAAFTLSATAADFTDIIPDESLHGWTRIPIPPVDGLKPKLQWRVDASQHALICTGDGGHEWLRYDQVLGDFILEVDWRFTPRTTGPTKYNSGVGVRLSKYGEIWTQAQTGPTGGYLFGTNLTGGAIEFFNLMKEMKENRVKPAGEWNHYEVRAEGDKVTLAVNGAVVNEISGISLRRGYIGLEAEGYEITFKTVRIKQLP